MNIPDFIEELVEAGIDVTLKPGGGFYIEGFYKSGSVTIKWDTSQWVLCARYNEVTPISSLDDLVEANYYWWQRSKDRNTGWKQPASAWVPLLLRFGYIEEKTIPETKVYEAKR